jgi:glycosyltransferase involved in cell wall biosynthesis
MSTDRHSSSSIVSFVVACNNEAVLRSSLLASPDLVDAEVIIERDPPSASKAYNAGLDRSHGDLVVFVHQDVFFPPGWIERLRQAARHLDASDPNWAVLGVFGLDAQSHGCGRVYSTGLQRTVGSPLPFPARVQSLDEVVLVVRRSSGLRFDDALPGFHLYGTDLCQEAGRRGFSAYVFEGFCVHNSNGISVLPRDYWKAWVYMRRKWWDVLPIATPCMDITRSGWNAARYLLKEPLRQWLGASRPGRRVEDPTVIWRNMEAGA